MCNNCIHKPVCGKFLATGGHVNSCEHHKEERKGEWVLCQDDGYEWYECSLCRTKPLNDNNERPVLSGYCPNCGAHMEGIK